MFKFLLVVFLASTHSCANGAGFDQPTITQITDPVDHTEEPSWDGRKNILFFVDIHTGRVFSYNYYTNNVSCITLDGEVTPVIPAVENNLLIVGLNRSLVTVEWDGTNKVGTTKVISTVTEQFPQSRFNDGKADKNGRLWIGTMGPEPNGTVVPNEGVLYEFTKHNLDNPTVKIAPVNISNGLAWNKANDQFYYIDSNSYQIVVYDFDLQHGLISNPRVVFDVKKDSELAGVPDGMTIDVNDNLWVALYGGGSIIHINSTSGELLNRIALPARDVTPAMWGGPDLDILFVTTSRVLLTEEEKLYYPAAGSVFAIQNLKTKGRPVFNANMTKKA